MTTPINKDPKVPPTGSNRAVQDNCRNCGTPLKGRHCYCCGQPVTGLVRPLRNLLGDLMDSVFNIDARIVRTLGPLFTKPGFLSREYFAGREVRYVTPVRLFFFLCILAFFVARFAIGGGSSLNVDINDPQAGEIGAALTEAEVIIRRDAALRRLDEGKVISRIGTRTAQAINATASRRLADLREASAAGKPPPGPMQDELRINGKPWDARTNPLHVTGAPSFVDAWINRKIERANDNVGRLKADPGRYLDAFVGAIPTALFVLVPVFALMLKLTYLLRRRLYMEHLVVALHSHAFLSLDLLMVFGCLLLRRLVPDNGLLDTC